jgi:hypothetical protein
LQLAGILVLAYNVKDCDKSFSAARRQAMSKKLQALLALFCMVSYASAGTTVLGTASARGDMRVDGYAVKGDATVFDGSVVETGDASVNLRVGHGVGITMSKSSRGTVYRDRFVLQRGESELTTPGSFELEANGLRVAANKPNSVAIVGLTPKNTVQVAALAGSLEVRDGQGILLSNVLPGRPLTFAMQGQASSSPYSVSTVGMLDFENGQYYLTTDENVKYALTGLDFQKFVGDKVVISGMLQPAIQPAGTAGTIAVKTIEINGPYNRKAGKWMIIGTALGGAGTVAWVIYDAEQPPPSR